jgi:hypothetical protein
MLSRLMNEVAEMLSGRASDKGLEVHVESAVLPGLLLGDAMRIRQALINYANNAIKFTERGSIRLRAEVIAEDAQGVLVRLAVEDTGIGIEPECGCPLVYAFRAGRLVDHAPLWRYRPWTGDHPPSGPIDGAARPDVESTPGHGSTVLDHGAAEAGAGRR